MVGVTLDLAAGRRLSTRTHQISPRRGRLSPFIFGVLCGHALPLIFAPGLVVFGDVPAVTIQVGGCLQSNALCFVKLGQKP